MAQKSHVLEQSSWPLWASLSCAALVSEGFACFAITRQQEQRPGFGGTRMLLQMSPTLRLGWEFRATSADSLPIR